MLIKCKYNFFPHIIKHILYHIEWSAKKSGTKFLTELREILTIFQNSFTDTFIKKYVMVITSAFSALMLLIGQEGHPAGKNALGCQLM